MLHSTVTSKGQTTIPGEARQAHHVEAGDRLEYADEDLVSSPMLAESLVSATAAAEKLPVVSFGRDFRKFSDVATAVE